MLLISMDLLFNKKANFLLRDGVPASSKPTKHFRGKGVDILEGKCIH